MKRRGLLGGQGVGPLQSPLWGHQKVHDAVRLVWGGHSPGTGTLRGRQGVGLWQSVSRLPPAPTSPASSMPPTRADPGQGCSSSLGWAKAAVSPGNGPTEGRAGHRPSRVGWDCPWDAGLGGAPPLFSVLALRESPGSWTSATVQQAACSGADSARHSSPAS